MIGVLATDLLMGIAIGICVNFCLHLKNGAPVPSLFKPQIQVDRENGRPVMVKVKDSAIFSTWIALKKTLESVASEPHVILDFIRHVFGGSHDDGKTSWDGKRISRTAVSAGDCWVRSSSTFVKTSGSWEKEAKKIMGRLDKWGGALLHSGGWSLKCLCWDIGTKDVWYRSTGDFLRLGQWGDGRIKIFTKVQKRTLLPILASIIADALEPFIS